MTMWFVYAAGAAMLWGIAYVYMEPVVHRISVPTYLGIASAVSLIVLLGYAALRGDLPKDLAALGTDHRLLAFFVVAVAGGVGANLLIVNAVAAKSAPYAAAIEIAYPLFVVLFAWLIFRQPVNVQVLAGALLIFAGAVVISLA